ncbi:glycosyltransferase [Weeksella virosa]|uniref:glycosyltransferase n=1 Tax=Weeksella virosa TaxID=1014 RepID=UPI002554F9BB|nr:glycosyltransferase [Weeksella virosa]MDK7375196.1 glycosyltransferase [Weeksella virosa]MDK7675238.1 glycosyltransferase [Weeksella virosa]
MDKKTVFFIGLVWPEPTSSAAGWRIIQLIELFLQFDYKVIFGSSAQKSDYSFPLNSLSVEEIQLSLNDASFDDYIKQLLPDIVVYDRFITEEQFGWRVKEFSPKSIQILDTEDLHFLREARTEAYKNKTTVSLFPLSTLAKRELSSIYRSDLSLIISEKEEKLLTEQFNIPPELLFYLPFLEKLNKTEYLPNFHERSNFCFIGNFMHLPNYETVKIIKKIWPTIRKQLPKAEMHIYGAYCTKKVQQLKQPKEGLYVLGRTENSQKMMQNYRILLAPIPFGAGLKGKFIDAMHAGTPSVTSPIGAEGICDDDWPGYFLDENDTYQNLINLYLDEKLWHEKQTLGYQLLKQKFDLNLWSCIFKEKIDDISNNILSYRNQNIVGTLMQQQGLMATKYLSKWIEEKNK